MDLNTLGESDRMPWRMHRCFHNSPNIQVETMDNLLHKHLPCIAAWKISNNVVPMIIARPLAASSDPTPT